MGHSWITWRCTNYSKRKYLIWLLDACARFPSPKRDSDAPRRIIPWKSNHVPFSDCISWSDSHDEDMIGTSYWNFQSDRNPMSLDPESDRCLFLHIFLCILPEFKDKCGMPRRGHHQLYTDDDLALIPEVCIYFRIRSYMKPTMVYQNHESDNFKVYICRLSSSHSFKQFIALIVPASFR